MIFFWKIFPITAISPVLTKKLDEIPAKVAAPPNTSFNTLVGVLIVSSAVEPKTVNIISTRIISYKSLSKGSKQIMCKNFDPFFKPIRASKLNEN